jgi:4-nitrophenyl phosphatase
MIGAMALPRRLRLVIFDLDGVIYRGDEPIRGARELVAWLHARGVGVRFATNNSMVTRAGYVERLGVMGIPTSVDEIVTSTSATVEHLRRHEPGVRSVLAVGAAGMRDEMLTAGLDVTMAADIPAPMAAGGPLARGYDAVIIGLDPALDYQRLAAAMTAVAAGARLIATNADTRYPTAAGFLPGAGGHRQAGAGNVSRRPRGFRNRCRGCRRGRRQPRCRHRRGPPGRLCRDPGAHRGGGYGRGGTAGR